MLHHFVPDSRFLSRLTLLLLVASPTSTAFALEEERRSTLHTYTPAIRNDPSPFHCTDCWDLKPDQRSSLPQHQAQRSRRGHHDRGLRPHKNPFAKKSHSFSRGLRSLPRHALSMGGFERTVEPWQVRTVDGDMIRYGTDRIRIRGVQRAGSFGWSARSHFLSVRPNDVFVNGQNVADVMTGKDLGKKASNGSHLKRLCSRARSSPWGRLRPHMHLACLCEWTKTWRNPGPVKATRSGYGRSYLAQPCSAPMNCRNPFLTSGLEQLDQDDALSQSIGGRIDTAHGMEPSLIGDLGSGRERSSLTVMTGEGSQAKTEQIELLNHGAKPGD